MEKRAGIIFDMDGTLWDSAEGVALSWTEMIQRFPNPDRSAVTTEEVHSVMGLTMDAISRILFPTMKDAERTALMDQCMANENKYLAAHGGTLYEGLEDTLKALRQDGWPLFIVSNCQSGYIEAFLDHYRFWPYFEDIDCYGNTGLSKDGTMRLLADRDQLDPFWYVGDIQGDCDATLKAGGRFIHAAYGFGTVRQKVPELQDIRDLPGLMRELRN